MRDASHLRLSVLLCLLICLMDRACGAPEVILQTGFEGPQAAQALTSWRTSGNGLVGLAIGFQGKPSLRVEQPVAQGAGTTTVSIPLPVARMRGTRVNVRAMIRAEAVATPPQVYNGVKLMLVIVTPSGRQYPARMNLWGTFDWRPEAFQAVIPSDATEAVLVLGVEQTTGTAWFDDVRVTAVRPYAGTPVTSGPAYTGHAGIPRLRGAMVSPDVTADDLRVLGGEWGANLIRYQLYWVTPEGRPDGWRDLAAYDAWLDGRLNYLDSLLPACRKYGLHVVVDLHTPPGGNILLPGYVWPLFQERRYQNKFLQVWDRIARRYKGNKTVWGYDLANEPIPSDVAEGLMDWHALATRAAQLVRRIDPEHAIIVEPGPGGGYDQIRFFAPLPVRGIVYSVHMYEPGAFTMQGVTPGLPTGVTYPGTVQEVYWDRAQMEKSLQTVADYQHHYHVAIYIGEFSAVRWAPGAAQYLRDAIDIFEKNGWDWSYHAFREWQGWSVEYPSAPKATRPAPTPTDRERLLRAWYAKNRKVHANREKSTQ
ncbi:MAG: cellulase family glycosylhydrolase [Armatimonadetes bacterium]|nr:cellulase family glycosylhydrolase [Armatimonadota bacterium]